MRRLLALALAVLNVGCAGTAANDGDMPAPCDYPAGAAEPMAQGQVSNSYVWPAALEANRTERSLNLTEVYCDADDDIDWSPFDMLLFVSIPAW
jgi:hypothetical protein